METNIESAIEKAKQMLGNTEFQEKIKDLVHINGFKDFLKSFTLIWWILKRIVAIVEEIYTQFNLISNTDRIEVAAQLLDDIIVFKGWLSIFEPFDKILFKLLLSAAVQALNDKYGHGTWASYKIV